MNDKEKEFIACLKDFVKVTCYDPYIILTHAWHESGAFNHIIGEWNAWGIKRPYKWQGLVKVVTTHEYIKGIKTEVKDFFIDFNTCIDALKWYDSLIQRLYPESYMARQKYEDYFDGLQKFKYKYATDPKYSILLKQLYIKLKNQNLLS